MLLPIRIVGVGAGYFSRFHYDAWKRIDGALPLACVDHDGEQARATGLTPYTALAPALAAEKPDLVDIITPPPTHLPLIGEIIDHGVRAIVCQKPFCRDLDEARQAVDLAARAGVELIIHENFRFQPWYRVIRREIDNGRIGTLLQFSFRLRPGDGQGEQAYLDRQPYFRSMPRFLVRETAIHYVDVFRYIAGEPDTVYSDLRRLNPAIAGEDAGMFIFGYANGTRALFDGNRLLDHAAENHRMTMGEALVEGTEGVLTLCGDGSVTRRVFQDRAVETVLPAQDYPGFGGDCVYALQKHVIDGLAGHADLENRAEAYLRNLELTELIYRSDTCGKRLRAVADR